MKKRKIINYLYHDIVHCVNKRVETRVAINLSYQKKEEIKSFSEFKQ